MIQPGYRSYTPFRHAMRMTINKWSDFDTEATGRKYDFSNDYINWSDTVLFTSYDKRSDTHLMSFTWSNCFFGSLRNDEPVLLDGNWIWE